MKQRFLTIDTYQNGTLAFAESDNWQAALGNDDVADWVWQFADSKEQAIAQHAVKHDEWEADPLKETY